MAAAAKTDKVPEVSNKKVKEPEKQQKVQIKKIRDGETGGLPSIKNEDFFHGFLPKDQTNILLERVGDFLVRQAVKAECKTTVIEQYIISVRVTEKNDDANSPLPSSGDSSNAENPTSKSRDEIRHVLIKYSRRARLYYVHCFGFTLASGLVEYHKRRRFPIDVVGTCIMRAIRRADWQLNHEMIIKTKKLGDGAFGDVFMGSLRTGMVARVDVAVKTINGTITVEENEKLFQEAMMMKKFVHPNVVQLVGVASNEEPVMIVMELAPGGSVLHAVESVPGPEVVTRINYCLGAASGLEYLASEHIIHRDIAARNVLIGKKNEAKISDFGLSIVGVTKKEKKLAKVPVRYLAPETLAQGTYTNATDVWSFGVFMWEVFNNGKEPYGQIDNNREVRKFVLSGNRMGNESKIYPDFLWALTQDCWKDKGDVRPPFSEITTIINRGIQENYKPKKRFIFF